MQIYRLREALPWWKTRLIYILAPVYKSSKRFTLRKRVSERTMAKDSGHYVFPSPENNTHTFYRISDRVKRERVTSPVCRIISFYNSSRQPPSRETQPFPLRKQSNRNISWGGNWKGKKERKKGQSKKWPYRISRSLLPIRHAHTTSIARWRPVGELNNAVSTSRYRRIVYTILFVIKPSRLLLPSLSTSFSFEFFLGVIIFLPTVSVEKFFRHSLRDSTRAALSSFALEASPPHTLHINSAAWS